ncbi:MAG: hypothetical protein V4638_05240 [Bacteroidota bacterium]
MVRISFFGVALFLLFTVSAQEEVYIRPGTLKASLTISPAKMLNRNANNIYLNGFIAYQLDKNVSLRGESFVFIPNAAKVGSWDVYKQQIKINAGAFYHRGIKNWDNYLGFQPGIQLFQTSTDTKYHVAPNFALKIGTCYYVWKYFHFFADLTYMKASINGIGGVSMQKADELIFSAGLGFQINTQKKEIVRTGHADF